VFVSLYSWYFLSVRGVLSSSRFATVRFFWDCSGCGSICFVVGGSYGGSSIHGFVQVFFMFFFVLLVVLFLCLIRDWTGTLVASWFGFKNP
jgi:hypothetical protein